MSAVKHLLAFILVCTVTSTANSQSRCPGSDDHFLTIEVPGHAEPMRHLCLSDLDNMPTTMFSTTTLWTLGEQQFEGVWLATLLRQLGLNEGDLTLHAINDYTVTAQVSDFQDGGALLAFRRNGEVMSSRNKGPFWLVWNYDSDPSFRSEQIYALSIWQLDRISVSR